MFMVSLTTNTLVAYIAAFGVGPALIARMGCGFLMLMEHMPTHRQAAIGAVIMVSEGLCQVIWVFFLTCISKNTFHLMFFAIGLNILTAIMFYWVPESPRYLYGINDLEKCKEVFCYIAKFNRV